MLVSVFSFFGRGGPSQNSNSNYTYHQKKKMSPAVPNTPVEVAELNLLLWENFSSVIINYLNFCKKKFLLSISIWPNLGPPAASGSAAPAAM